MLINGLLRAMGEDSGETGGLQVLFPQTLKNTCYNETYFSPNWRSTEMLEKDD